ncbi:DNA polymerase III subunit epsilon [Psychrobacter sp. FDAARGOS_221]|nr:DNA polymerase III subunit epsilon [Psychrobacter sp. FDAARGOS_221]
MNDHSTTDYLSHSSAVDSAQSTSDDWLFSDPLGFDDVVADEPYPIEDNDNTMNQTFNDPLDQNMPVDAPIVETTETELVEAEIEFDGDTSRANPHFKPLLPKPIHSGESGRQLIMDTETTGLDALKGDRIIEVGIVELVNRKFTGEKLHVYINPQRGMDEEVIRVHGISEAFLADKPTFDKVAQQLYDFMLGAEVIAHNAPFDISFLSMEFDKVGLTDFAEKITVTDSLVLAKQQYPGQKNTLDALVRRLNVGKMDRTFHGALLDSEILAEVYLAMTGGQVALAIDEDIQTEGASSHANFSHLADKLLAAKAQFNDHVSWVAKLVGKHPSLADTQGITCFHQVVDPQSLPSMLYQKSATQQPLAHNLYLSS